MKQIFFLIIGVFMYACEKGNTDNSNNITISVLYQLIFVDSNGNNLLNPNFPDSYQHSEIKLFQDIDLKNEVSDDFLLQSNDNSFYFIEPKGGIESEFSIDNNRYKKSILYLKLDDNTIDTIYSESIYQGENLFLNKVKYNSEIVFNIGDSRAITIIKSP